MYHLSEIGRLPSPDDNCAIAVRTLPAGTPLTCQKTQFVLSHTILEGHRFAVRDIQPGAHLLSWDMPFGRALHKINAGDYLCNAAMLQALRSRRLTFELPDTPNFDDDFVSFELDPDRFEPAQPLSHLSGKHTFLGYRREGNRGVGTRNMVVLLGVNALVGGYCQQLEKEVKSLTRRYPNVDGIVAVAHTEGGQSGNNNQDLLLRTLAGFMVHPNVGAVLLLDAGDIGVTSGMLFDYAIQHKYPLHDVLHHQMTLRGPFDQDLKKGVAIIENWLPRVNALQRSPQPISQLKVALQCGGSDAFSGISGNPLAAWVSKEIIKGGGSAVLAETDELLGAESYVLQKVRDFTTAERFLSMSARFRKQAAWHGHSAHGNVSGGNLYRGLYNIYLKSLGAAVKKHPDVRLDYAINYGQLIEEPGYYFMDSPGNDLESIAGQVASGCNLIYFVTGNGSVTNFPFVPTIKIVTTSARYALLPDEMDVNAGRYLEGTSLEELGEETVVLSLDVASGQPSAGERAHHAQVQIWRNWQFTAQANIDQIRTQHAPDGLPLSIDPPKQLIDTHYTAWQTETGIVSDRVGLILPSSLCSGQIAAMAAKLMDDLAVGVDRHVSRFAALVHTEGCGNSTEVEYIDTMLGYMTHPLVATCLILEHGCEKTHNDFWRQRLQDAGIDCEQFGWASVQMDGGIKQTLAKIEAWFKTDCARIAAPPVVTADFKNVRLGLMSEGEVDPETAISLAAVTQQIVAAGGILILPANDPLAVNRTFTRELGINMSHEPTCSFACHPLRPGFHLMDNPGYQWLETLSGLGASGVELLLAVVTTRTQQGHPFIPVLQVAAESENLRHFKADLDLILQGSSQHRLRQMVNGMTAVLSRKLKPKLSENRNIGFQITRGRLGVSL